MIINNIESIDRDVLGKYFANPSDESQKLFKVFCGQLNLKDLEIDEALRELLYYFSLPGESQQIDRIVTVFSEEYCLQNPTKLCGNSVYLVAYALIMLQTDAHNPNVQKKMDLTTFSGIVAHIKINEKTPLEQTEIVRLYQSVTERPLGVHYKHKKRAEQ
jgi:Sec7-like guanine-nucleotide exchange factor